MHLGDSNRQPERERERDKTGQIRLYHITINQRGFVTERKKKGRKEGYSDSEGKREREKKG